MRVFSAITVALLASACALKPPPEAVNNFVTVSLALVPNDVASITATVTGPNIDPSISEALAFNGDTASGTIPGVPTGANQLVTVNAYPAAPENTLVIYTGSASAAVEAGQNTNVNISLEPVNGSVAVTANFPAGDPDVGSVAYTAVVVSGARVLSGLTYYLTLGSGSATGTAVSVPVGDSRTFTVGAYNSSAQLLFAGSATASVASGSNSVAVDLVDENGSVSIDGGFCEPDCTGSVCGSDGCNGSCGGCMPGQMCNAGTCGSGSGGSGWSQPSPSNIPPARENHAMAFDSARSKTVMFGGANATSELGDTWEWDGSNWTLANPATSPAAREQCSLAYDSARGNSVLFGGWDRSTRRDDTWMWDGTNWVEGAPSTMPDARAAHALSYDSANGVTVLFGGNTASSTAACAVNDGSFGFPCDDTWLWDGANWTQANPATVPPARHYQPMVYDSARNVTVMFGGRGSDGAALNDTWLWDGTNWTQASPAASPPARYWTAMAFNPASGVSVLFAGCADPPGPDHCSQTLDDTWAWDGTNWIEIMPASSPVDRLWHAMAFDANGRTVLFGGVTGPTYLNDTWEF